MVEFIRNKFSISQIELVFFNHILPNLCYNCFHCGRGSCGLIIAVNGEASYTFRDGSSQKISAGQAALLSDTVAYVATNNGDIPFTHYVINFSLTDDFPFESDIFIKPVNFKDFSQKAEQLLSYWHSGEPMSFLRCMSVLYELIADMLENKLIDNIGANTYHSVLPAIQYIDKNYFTEISVSGLAKLCMMSNTNFRRIFTALCGMSPIQYLLDVRIRHAKEFLSPRDCSVAEIAQKCGFNDVEHFCRTFKKRTGTTPTRFTGMF